MYVKGEYTLPTHFDYIKIALLPCNETNFPDAECASQEERTQYWKAAADNDTKIEFAMITQYKQVNMKNTTELMQPVYHYIEATAQNKKEQFYDVWLA